MTKEACSVFVITAVFPAVSTITDFPIAIERVQRAMHIVFLISYVCGVAAVSLIGLTLLLIAMNKIDV